MDSMIYVTEKLKFSFPFFRAKEKKLLKVNQSIYSSRFYIPNESSDGTDFGKSTEDEFTEST